mgnify:CR=1 FL=1
MQLNLINWFIVNMFLKTLLHFVHSIYFCAVAAILLIPQISFCQITFFKTYGDTAENHSDKGNAVLQTEDGGYIVAGEYGSYHTGPPYRYYGDVYLIKTDEYGDTIWTKTYGDANTWEAAYSMDKTNDGGYIVSAFIQYPLWQLWLIKTDSQGDSIWSKLYPVREGFCIRQTTDGGYVITGGSADIYLLKINSQGDILWLKNYDNNSDWEEGKYVQQTSDGGYIISGMTEFPAPRSFDIWLIKTDSYGDTLWTKTYGGDYIDEPHSICETKDGGYFIAGEYTEYGELGLEAHIWLLRTDSKGDTIWTKKINNGSWGDYAYSMKKTSDGGFIIAGETAYDNFDSDIYLIKLDEEGNYQWFSSIGRNMGEIGDEKHYRGIDVIETSDNGYVITGFKWIYIGWDSYTDLCLLKVDNKGHITSVNEPNAEIPLNFVLLQNFPNPFNPSTVIKYSVGMYSHTSLRVYDVLGREVAILVNENKQPGSYMVQWNASNFPSGIYFYRLSVVPLAQRDRVPTTSRNGQASEFDQCRKMVLVK